MDKKERERGDEDWAVPAILPTTTIVHRENVFKSSEIGLAHERFALRRWSKRLRLSSFPKPHGYGSPGQATNQGWR